MPESSRRRWLRYAAVAAIVAVIAGLFVQRELLGGDAPAASGGAAGGLGPADDRKLVLDAEAPDFLLANLAGEEVRLSDYRGKTVLVNFWASWCPPCRAEMPELQALWEERGTDGADDFVLLAVNLLSEDSEGAARRFIEGQGLTFPVLFDTPNGDVAASYGVRGLPNSFFIDRKGIVRTTAFGPVYGGLLETALADADTEGGTVAP